MTLPGVTGPGASDPRNCVTELRQGEGLPRECTWDDPGETAAALLAVCPMYRGYRAVTDQAISAAIRGTLARRRSSARCQVNDDQLARRVTLPGVTLPA